MRMGTRVYVGKLPYDVRERDLEKFFKGYGRVREILMKDGFAFVEFDDHRDADDAVYDLNGKDLMGERVHVEFAREQRGPRGRFGGGGSRYGSGRYESRRGGSYRSGGGSGGLHYAEKYGPPRNTEYRVIVENLSSRVSWQDLKDFMRQAGEVTYADAHKRERNMGIVDFNSHTDMKNAIEKLDGSEMHGRRIRLVEDKTRRRGRSTSRSRRSRTRSRSRSRRSRSRSSRSRSRSKSRSRSRSRSHVKKSRSRSVSRSKSRSRSVEKRRSRSRSADKNGNNDRSRSRSYERNSYNRSKSKSPADRKPSKSRSRSLSPSAKDDEMNGKE